MWFLCWLQLSLCIIQNNDWEFHHAYPAHGVVYKLHHGEVIHIDGNLDEPAWQAVDFQSTPFVDIAESLYPNISVPGGFQTRVKVRWDNDFFYVGAEVEDPLVWGSIAGHNDRLTGHRAPWWDNDFEVFVDPCGTTHYYKEFEMNLRNATYDVLWRVPDGGFSSVGVPCDPKVPGQWCQNTTFAGPSPLNNWTMYPRMTAQTNRGSLSRYVPFEVSGRPRFWVAEIAFPIRPGGGTGGLIDSNGDEDRSWCDPVRGQRYWWVDFARAQHPLVTVGSDALSINFGEPEYLRMCADVQKRWPTLLGTNQWGCYWEWVWQSVRATRYMHNPDMWGMLQFSNSTPQLHSQADECLNIEWPLRYILSMVYQTQVAFAIQTGVFATSWEQLFDSTICSPARSCNLTDFRTGLVGLPSIMNFTLVVDNTATHCVDYKHRKPTGGPCFQATGRFRNPPPGHRYEVVGTLREDRLTTMDHIGDKTDPPCLPRQV